MYESTSEPNVSTAEPAQKQGSVVERLSRYGMQVMPSAFQRRTRVQRQQEITDSSAHNEAPERASNTTAVRKRYMKELLLTKSASGFRSALSSSKSTSVSTREETPDADWALYPMEHAWMLSAVAGNYDTILEFISEDPYLLSRKDFISGYTVLHWLAKRGQDDTLLKLLHYAQSEQIPLNVDVRGSGGLTPLHLASMHGQYMVIKLLVGAFGASVDAMDYNGRRAWQYLKEDAPLEMKELLGMWDDVHHCSGTQNVNRNNNCTCEQEPVVYEELDAEAEENTYFDRTKARSSLRLGSFKKILKSFTMFGNP